MPRLTFHRNPRFPQASRSFLAFNSAVSDDVLSVRPITPDDDIREQIFLDTMSELDNARRFCCKKPSFGRKQLEELTAIDYTREFAYAACSRKTDRFVAVARLCAGSGVDFEAAVVVLDDWKGCGLGSWMVDLLFRAAIEVFQAQSVHISYLSSNPAVRRIHDRAAAAHATQCEEHSDGDMKHVTWKLKTAVDVELEVAEYPTQAYNLDGVLRKFDVTRPRAHPFSLWSFSLYMLKPHAGHLKQLQVRPLTPDDADAERHFLQQLPSEVQSWLHMCIFPDVGLEAKVLGQFNFAKMFAIGAVDAQTQEIIAVARWVDDACSGCPKAYLAVLDAWQYFGVASFTFDVMVQTAIARSKRGLELHVPSSMSFIVKTAQCVVSRHAISVTAAEVEEHGSSWTHLQAILKSSVDRPIVLTEYPDRSTATEAIELVTSRHITPQPLPPVPSRGSSPAPAEDDEADLWGY